MEYLKLFNWMQIICIKNNYLKLQLFIKVYYDWFALVSLFNDISTFAGYLMPKPFSHKNGSGTI